MTKRNVSALVTIGVLASVALFGWGCNPFQKAQDKISEKIGENVAEGLIGQATGGKVDIDKGGNQVTYKDNKTGATSAFGEDVKLPDNFPKSVPVYPGAKISGVTVSPEGGMTAWVMMTSDDEMQKVVDWYAGQAKDGGWTEDSNMTFDKTESRSYSKGNEKFSLTVTPNEDQSKGKTSIILNYNQEASDTSDTSTQE